ncbi:MAG: pilus assembly protein [Schwartzia sp.]|nr:pilus assembly protein [Schwartzia sp. (in: firmicutes)]
MLRIRLRKAYRVWRQRGSVIVLTALLLPLMLGFCGMAVDLGNLYIHKSRLQNTADAAALAGAAKFAGESETVTTHPQADAEAQRYVNKDMKTNTLPNETTRERYQAQEQDGVIYYRVALTENVPLYFLRIFIPEGTQDVSADSIVAISAGEEIVDEMFGFSMCAGHESQRNYDMRQVWSNPTANDWGIWFHTDNVHVSGDIMTNGKLRFDNSRNTTLDGNLQYSSDLKNCGSGFQDSYWKNGVQLTEYVTPSVWGRYDWGQNGSKELFTFVDTNGNPFVTENRNGTNVTETDNANVTDRDKIDISVANNKGIKDFIENIKSLSYSDREKQHTYYDDSNRTYNFSSSNDTSHFPALCPHGGTTVPSDATSTPVWNRWYEKIIVGGDIQVSFEKSPAPGENDSAIIVSLNGNIHIPNNMNFKGILYAPNGKVTIDGSAKVSGSIVAQQILITTGGQYIEAKDAFGKSSSKVIKTGATYKLANPPNLNWD